MTVRAEQIKQALAKKHGEDFFLTEVKTGRTLDNKELLKFDAFAMKRSWANPCLYGYEVKVSRSDFLKDQKWPGYLAYCNRFAFVCPKGLITPDELPDEVGLIWFYPDSGALVSKRPAKHRIVDIPADLYMYILMSRIESDRHPFFSSRREYFEAWIADKANRRDLGYQVGEKLGKEIIELRKAAEQTRYETDRWRADSELLQKLRTVLSERGVIIHGWSDQWQADLRAALAGGVNPAALREMSKLTAAATELQRMLQPQIREEQS